VNNLHKLPEKRMPDIVFVASFVVGLTVRLPRMPYPGESLVADLFDMGPGGKGTNMAVAAVRQGAPISAIVKVGDDRFADLAFDLYKAEHIDTAHIIRTPGESTAAGLVYLQTNGENCIGFYRGANWTLTPQEIDRIEPDMRGAKVLVTQLEIPDESVLHALELGKRHNLCVILNPAPARAIDPAILAQADIITPNAGEARTLAGIAQDDETVSVTEIGQRLLDLGAKTVIMTLGAHGCTIFERDTRPVEIPAYPVTPVDTVGAGDAFNGGLAVALSEGKSILDAARWANASAALSTTAIGSIRALPNRQQVESMIRSV
jgi:ribokinase